MGLRLGLGILLNAESLNQVTRIVLSLIHAQYIRVMK